MTLSLPREEVLESPWDLPQGSAASALCMASHFYRNSQQPDKKGEKNQFAMPGVIYFSSSFLCLISPPVINRPRDRDMLV